MSIEPIANNDPVGWHEKVNDLLAYWEMGGTAPATFGAARARLNDMADDLALPTIAEADAGSVRRAKINALIADSGLPAGLDLYADFTTGRYWDNGGQSMTTEVVDTWSGGYIPNAAGVYTSVAANVLARSDLGLLTQPTSTNQTRSSGLTGAVVGVIGAGGALPTGWQQDFSSKGLAVQVVQLGTQRGLPFIDLRVHGTATATFANLQFSASAHAPTTAASVWTGSIFSKLIAGAFASGSFALNGYARGPGGSPYIGNPVTVTLKTGGSGDLPRFSATAAMPASTGTTDMAINVTFLNGEVIDFTVRLACPQYENLPFATDPNVSPNNASVTRTGNRQVIDLAERLAYGVAGFVKVDIRQPHVAGVFPRLLDFNSGASSQRGPILFNSVGTLRFEVYNSAGATQGGVSLGSWQQGIQAIAFAAGPDFLMARRVGGVAPSADLSVEWNADLTKLGLGGTGIGPGDNTYQFAKKLGLLCGSPSQPVNQALFDQVYAMAVAA